MVILTGSARSGDLIIPRTQPDVYSLLFVNLLIRPFFS